MLVKCYSSFYVKALFVFLCLLMTLSPLEASYFPVSQLSPQNDVSLDKESFLTQLKNDELVALYINQKETLDQIALNLNEKNFLEQLEKTLDEIIPPQIAEQMDSLDDILAFKETVFKRLQEEGLVGASIATEYGGRGLNSVIEVLITVSIARRSQSAALVFDVWNGLTAYPIEQHGSEEQKMTILKKHLLFDLFVTFGLTEPDYGSDSILSMTTATPKESNTESSKEYILSGVKTWNTGGIIGTHTLVFAFVKEAGRSSGDNLDPKDRKIKAKERLTAFLVPITDDMKHKIKDKMGHKSTGTIELVLDGVVVNASDIVGKLHGGYDVMLAALNAGRISISSIILGSQELTLDELIKEYHKKLDNKEEFDQKSWEAKIAEMIADRQGARDLLFKMARSRDEDSNYPLYSLEAALLKLKSSEDTVKHTMDAMRLVGVDAANTYHPLSRNFRDNKLLTIGEGTTQIMRRIVQSFFYRLGNPQRESLSQVELTKRFMNQLLILLDDQEFSTEVKTVFKGLQEIVLEIEDDEASELAEYALIDLFAEAYFIRYMNDSEEKPLLGSVKNKAFEKFLRLGVETKTLLNTYQVYYEKRSVDFLEGLLQRHQSDFSNDAHALALKGSSFQEALASGSFELLYGNTLYSVESGVLDPMELEKHEAAELHVGMVDKYRGLSYQSLDKGLTFFEQNKFGYVLHLLAEKKGFEVMKRDFYKGGFKGAFALQDDPSDRLEVEPQEDDYYFIKGSKQFVFGGDTADSYFVLAEVTKGEFALFSVEKNDSRNDGKVFTDVIDTLGISRRNEDKTLKGTAYSKVNFAAGTLAKKVADGALLGKIIRNLKQLDEQYLPAIFKEATKRFIAETLEYTKMNQSEDQPTIEYLQVKILLLERAINRMQNLSYQSLNEVVPFIFDDLVQAYGGVGFNNETPVGLQYQITQALSVLKQAEQDILNHPFFGRVSGNDSDNNTQIKPLMAA